MQTTPVPDAEPLVGAAGNGLIAFSLDGDIYVGDRSTGTSTAVVVVENPLWALLDLNQWPLPCQGSALAGLS